MSMFFSFCRANILLSFAKIPRLQANISKVSHLKAFLFLFFNKNPVWYVQISCMACCTLPTVEKKGYSFAFMILFCFFAMYYA